MYINIPETNKKRIVLIGAGFGGLILARKLSLFDYQVVLIDRHNYHTFQPLLYQVATGGLEPGSIAHPLRKFIKSRPELILRIAEVTRIEAEAKEVHTNIGKLHYDILILATGSKTNFFGQEKLPEFAMRMKTVPQALDLRSMILQHFEEALLTSDLKERDAHTTFVVVGAGPTGVETAGALGELKKHVLPRDYPELDLRRMQIHLVEAGPRVLAGMSEQAGQRTLDFLKELDVQVWLGQPVQEYDGHTVRFASGKELRAGTLIWSAGVIGAAPEGLPDTVKGRGGRLRVDIYNRVEGLDGVYAIGDLAWMPVEEYPNGHPMVAPVAIQQARRLADNLNRLARGKEMRPFQYFDKGSMATIGRNRAVVDLGKIRFQGFFAWFVWMFVHLMSIVGFRNKMVVFVDWFWNYISYDRALRLIIRPFKR
jgi:NADH dehydrogenase